MQNDRLPGIGISNVNELAFIRIEDDETPVEIVARSTFDQQQEVPAAFVPVELTGLKIQADPPVELDR